MTGRSATRVAVIAADCGIGAFLTDQGFPVLSLPPEAVPSLTGLLLDHPEISGLVIQDGASARWSAPHVLDAAKHLPRGCPTVLLGGGSLTELCRHSPLVRIAQRVELIPPLLRRAFPTGEDDAAGGTAAGGTAAAASGGRRPAPAAPAPIRIPDGRILMLAVTGSQPRIGCTTQAIGLWHYCKALGLTPAVVSSPERIAQIAGAMRHEEISGGCRIDGIPFVAGTDLAYDCYILDLGVCSVPDGIDCLILTAGSKPWELPYTVEALRVPWDMAVLLSFTSEKDAALLRPLFGARRVLPAPWIPDPWMPDGTALRIYDTLLRPLLQRILDTEPPAPRPAPAPGEE